MNQSSISGWNFTRHLLEDFNRRYTALIRRIFSNKASQKGCFQIKDFRNSLNGPFGRGSWAFS